MTQARPVPDKVNKIAEKLAQAGSEMIQAAMMATQSHQKADAFYVGTIGIMSQVHIVASIIGKCEDGEDPQKPDNYINSGSLMFAALMAYRVGIDRGPNGISAEFSPEVITEVFDMMEKLGYRAEDCLDPGMVKATREFVREAEEGSKDKLIDFMSRRANALSSKTLN